MKNVFTVEEVPNSKRTSARNYTHAIIGVYDIDAAIKRANVINPARVQYYKDCIHEASLNVGDVIDKRYPYRKATAILISRAKDFLKRHPGGPDAYAAKERDFLVNLLIERKANEGSPIGVLRWSQSYSNALKGLSEFEGQYINLKIVETKKV